MSAPVTAPLATVAPAAANSASGIPDLVPAPGSTAISAPSAFIFLTVSGVAATRPSAASASRATAMRIHPSPDDRRGISGCASAARGEPERDEPDHHHDHAWRSRPAHQSVQGHDGCQEENPEGHQPVAGDRADRQSEHEVGDRGTADEDQMNET